MTIKNIKDTIICLGLDQYAFLSINNIDRGPRRISVIENNDKYDIYISNERGDVLKEAENLQEAEACETIIKLFESAKNLYEYYESKGKLEENGYYNIRK